MRYSVATVVHPFFFCVTPIPLTSTLFPYTTLFRSHRDRARQLFNNLRHTEVKSPALAPALLEFAQLELEDRHFRSEEHTSELQSHHDLVCRLLLEKKKRKIIVRQVTSNNHS